MNLIIQVISLTLPHKLQPKLQKLYLYLMTPNLTLMQSLSFCSTTVGVGVAGGRGRVGGRGARGGVLGRGSPL